MRQILNIAPIGVLVLGLVACGDGDDGDGPADTGATATSAATPGTGSDAAAPPADGERPSVVVTTNLLGDVVRAVVGDLADVEVVMPLGSDPHDFSPTVKQAASMEDADLLVVNGLGFEEGMQDLIDGVIDGGTPVFAFAEAVQPLEAEGGHDDGDDAAGEDTHDDTGDTHEGELPDAEGPSLDPHFWTDAARMAVAVGGFVDVATLATGIDEAALRAQADAYIAELDALDAEIASLLADVPADRRVLVTNHEVFAYFADRYDFEVVGAVVPSLTTSAETSSRELEALAELITAEGIPAIFAETTQSTELAEALADEVGGEVQVVELHTESLGEQGTGAETYIGLMRTNANLIAEALGTA